MMRAVGADDHDDAAGQFHQRPVAILARAQGQLGAHARRHVDRDAADERRGGSFDGKLQRGPPVRGAVHALTHLGHFDWLAALEHPQVALAELRRCFGRPELGICLADHDRRQGVELPSPRFVAVHIPAVGRLHVGDGRREPHERAEPRLGGAMFRLGPCALLDHCGDDQRRHRDDVHEGRKQHRLATVPDLAERAQAVGASRQRQNPQQRAHRGHSWLAELERAPDHQRERQIGHRQHQVDRPMGLREDEGADAQRRRQQRHKLDPPRQSLEAHAAADPDQQRRRDRHHAQGVADEEDDPGAHVARAVEAAQDGDVPGADDSGDGAGHDGGQQQTHHRAHRFEPEVENAPAHDDRRGDQGFGGRVDGRDECRCQRSCGRPGPRRGTPQAPRRATGSGREEAARPTPRRRAARPSWRPVR